MAVSVNCVAKREQPYPRIIFQLSYDAREGNVYVEEKIVSQGVSTCDDYLYDSIIR